VNAAQSAAEDAAAATVARVRSLVLPTLLATSEPTP
jgi:hypothetical protein